VETYREILSPLVSDDIIDANGFHHYLRKLIVNDLMSRISDAGGTIDDYMILVAVKKIMKLNKRYFDESEYKSISLKITRLKQKYKYIVEKKKINLVTLLNKW